MIPRIGSLDTIQSLSRLIPTSSSPASVPKTSVSRPSAWSKQAAAAPSESLLGHELNKRLEKALEQATPASMVQAASKLPKPQSLREQVAERLDVLKQKSPKEQMLSTGEAGVLLEAALGKEFNAIDWTYLFKQRAYTRAENKAAEWVRQLPPDHAMLITLHGKSNEELREALAFALGQHLPRFQGLGYVELPPKHQQAVDAMLRGLRQGEAVHVPAYQNVLAADEIRSQLIKRMVPPPLPPVQLQAVAQSALDSDTEAPLPTLRDQIASRGGKGLSPDQLAGLEQQSRAGIKQARQRLADGRFDRLTANQDYAPAERGSRLASPDELTNFLKSIPANKLGAEPLKALEDALESFRQKHPAKADQAAELMAQKLVRALAVTPADQVQKNFASRPELAHLDVDGEQFVKAALTKLMSEFHFGLAGGAPQIDGFEYKVGDIIGSGAAGYVNKYFSEGAPDIAVKTSNSIDEFQKELKIFLEFSQERGHPNLLQLKGFFLSDDRYCLVTEFAEHGSLEKWQKTIENALVNGFISQKSRELLLRSSLAQCIEGMAYLQKDQQMMHFDLKPQNILVHANGYTQIADLGTVKVGRSHLPLPEGTILYASPEHNTMKSDLTYKHDVWSLGAIVMEVMRNQKPIPHETMGNDAQSQLKKFGDDENNRMYFTGPRPANQPASIGHAVEKIEPFHDMINAMMHPNPAKRPTLESVAGLQFFADPMLGAPELEKIAKLLTQKQSPERDEQLKQLDLQLKERLKL